MATYPFNGRTIEVEFVAFRAFLWLLAGFVVRVGDRSFWPHPTGVRFSTSTEFELLVDGQHLEGSVRSLGPMWFRPGISCSIVVAGKEIARDFLPLRHWLQSYLAWGLVLCAVILASVGAVVIAALVWKATHAI